MIFKRQLPYQVNNFIGRTRELKRLCSFFYEQKIIIIAGIAGVGKTELAKSYAQIINENNEYLGYNNRVVWVSCEKNWKINSFFIEINNWLLDKELKDYSVIYKSNDIEIEEKFQHLINVLENNNIVLFIDEFQNIENDDTRLFIRYCKKYLKKAKIIITTRSRIKLPALDRVDILEMKLEGLSNNDSKTLIKDLLKNHNYYDLNSKNLRKINEKVKGHPFLIKLFVSLLITDELTLEEFLDDSIRFNNEIEDFLIEKIYEDLPEDEKETLLILSMFRKKISFNVISYFNSNINIKKVKKNLIEKYIVESDHNKNYTIHDILKTYCKQKIPLKKEKNLHKKCAEYLEEQELTTSNKLELFYHYFEIDKFKKVREIANEIINDLEVQGQFQELMDIIEKTLSITKDFEPLLILKKARILKQWKQTDDALELYNELLNNIEDNILKAKVIKEIAVIKEEKGNYNKAIEMYYDSYSIYDDNNDIEGKSVTLNEIASVYSYQQKYEISLETFEKALELAKKINNNVLKTKIYNNIGTVYLALGDFDKALVSLEKTLNISIVERDNKTQMITLYTIAYLYFEKKEFNRSLKYAEQVKQMSKESSNKFQLTYTLNLIGEIYLEQEKKADAFENFTLSLNLAEVIEDLRAKAGALKNIGKYYYNDKKYKYSLDFIVQSSKLYKDLKLKKSFLSTKLIEALCYLKQENIDDFKDVNETILRICNELNDNKYFVYFYKLNEIYFTQINEEDQLKQYKNLFNNKYKKLTIYEKAQIDQFYKQEFSEKDSIKYILNTSKEEKYITMNEFEELRKNKDKYDIFVDLVNNEVIEKEKGIIKILNKRTLSLLFLCFINNPDKEFTFSELFQKIWEREYDFETDGITLRVNISRLRSLLGESKNKIKYIKISESGGKYFFDKKTNYCLIKEIKK